MKKIAGISSILVVPICDMIIYFCLRIFSVVSVRIAMDSCMQADPVAPAMKSPMHAMYMLTADTTRRAPISYKAKAIINILFRPNLSDHMRMETENKQPT